MGGVRRAIALTLGYEELPRSVSVHGDRSGIRLREPVPALLLECEGGWLLLDTGFNTALLRDQALYRRFHGGDGEIVPVLTTEGEPLLEAFERAGLAVTEITAVALSHLHNDHAGALRLFAGSAPVHLQRKELAYGLSSPDAERNGIFRIDFDDPAIDWVLHEGDVEIAPGVTALASPGHTPGHQSFLVEFDEHAGGGGYLFAFDAADLTYNIEHEVAVGGFIDCGPEATVEQIRRLKAIAQARGVEVVPGHDPERWPAITEELARRGR